MENDPVDRSPNKPPFEQTGGTPVGFEVGAGDHKPVGRLHFCGQVGKDAVEDTHARPANEPVVQGLVVSSLI